MNKTTFIFDIDSTIADNSHRAVLLKKHCRQCAALLEDSAHRAVCQVCGHDKYDTPQASWDAFLDPVLILQDEPIADAQRLITHLVEQNIPFHYITGRSERLRDCTERWLNLHFPKPKDLDVCLYMRPNSMQNVPASQIKELLLFKLLAQQGLTQPSLIFFEDDKHVFGMYNKHGVVVQCPEGLKYFCPEHDASEEPSWKR